VNLFMHAQLAAVALILGAAAVAKLAQQKVIDSTRSVFLLGRLAPRSRRFAWYSMAVVEGTLAVSLVALPERAPRIAAVLLFVGMSLFALAATRFAPESTCGCLGTGTAVTWRTIARAALLAIMSGSALVSTGGAFPGGASAVIGLLLLEVLVLGRLSLPAGLTSTARHLQYRLRTPPCLTSNEPLAVTVSRVQASQAWRTLAVHLVDADRAGVLDHWREGCWRFLTFAAGDGDAQLVFAVHLPPGRVSFSGALVLEDGTTAATAASREPRWRQWRRPAVPTGQLSTAG
jgi:hypothetical protein